MRRNTKLDEEIVRMIRASRQSNADLGRLLGVSRETIRQCRARTTWGDVK